MALHFRKTVPFAAVLSLAALVAAANSSCNSSSQVGLASTCSINSDCGSPLICAFAKCHSACSQSRDCGTGQRCVKTGTTGICQLPAESTCGGAGASCQSGQVCGSGQQCRTQCSPSIACATGDFCLLDGTTNACFAPANASDQLVLMAAGITGPDGGLIGDASVGNGDANGTGPDGAGSGDSGDATMAANDGAPGSSDGTTGNTPDGAGGKSDASDGGGTTVVPNSCPTAQTQFGNTAQGDSNPNFTSGVGVRTATSFLIFSGYSGPDPAAGAASDAGDAGTVNLVYVQAFDPTTASPLGPARPLFTAPPGPGFALESASIAPTGQIALAFNYSGDNYGGGFVYPAGANNVQVALYAAFLGASADAGPAAVVLQRPPVRIESAQINGQPHITWSVATGAFVFSWEYYSANAWFLGIKNFRPNGQAVGGSDPVPLGIAPFAHGAEQGSVAAGPDLFGVAYRYNSGNVYYGTALSLLDLSGNQVGNPVIIQGSVLPSWNTVAATAAGFVYLYDQNGVTELLVPTSADAGAVSPPGDAGLAGFTFTGGVAAKNAHAINDDTGGLGGVGVALLYSNGLSFAYINRDGLTHVGPLSVIPSTFGNFDQINITNFGGSFGLSLYSAASQSTQMAASGCQ